MNWIITLLTSDGHPTPYPFTGTYEDVLVEAKRLRDAMGAVGWSARCAGKKGER